MNKPVVCVAGAALLLVACSRPAPPEEPVRAVKVITVGTRAYAPSREYAGEVRAQVESRLGFRIGGKLVKRQAELGQQVRAGQVLAQPHPQDYPLAADAAPAHVAAAATNRHLMRGYQHPKWMLAAGWVVVVVMGGLSVPVLVQVVVTGVVPWGCVVCGR